MNYFHNIETRHLLIPSYALAKGLILSQVTRFSGLDASSLQGTNTEGQFKATV